MIELRPATINDLGLLLYWDKKQHVIDCDPDDDWNWETELKRNPDWREQFIAELNGEPVGMVQIIDPLLEETHYWGNVENNKRAIDIWIGEEITLNKGYGTEMMKLAIRKCFSHPTVNGILADPLKTNVRAHRFYKKLGFELMGERKFNGTACYVFELRRNQGTPLQVEKNNKG